MRVLLDTCVISEVRRDAGHPGVREQVEAIPSRDLFLSVVTVGELSRGIELLEEGRRKRALRRWFLALERDYAERVLPVDLETAHVWGELSAAAQARGRPVSVSDGLIAATAIRHGLHVMTRNVADFTGTGARLVNPWAEP